MSGSKSCVLLKDQHMTAAVFPSYYQWPAGCSARYLDLDCNEKNFSLKAAFFDSNTELSLGTVCVRAIKMREARVDRLLYHIHGRLVKRPFAIGFVVCSPSAKRQLFMRSVNAIEFLSSSDSTDQRYGVAVLQLQ